MKDYAKTTGSISTEFGGRIGNRPKKSPLNFGVGLDQGMDPEFFFSVVQTAVWDIFCPVLLLTSQLKSHACH